jgi:hypothetical protein
VGGLRLAVETGKTQSKKKCLKTRRVPTCPLHAMLGGFVAQGSASENDHDNFYTVIVQSPIYDAETEPV